MRRATECASAARVRAIRDRPFPAFARALGRAALPPALLRAAPPFAALGLASSIVFGGYGMSPRDLVRLLDASAAARASLWAAWILVTAPAARALLTTPEALVLRSLPVPLGWFRAVHGAHLVALQAPWMLLFAAGAGALSSIAAGLAAAAASAIWVARPRALLEIAAAIALSIAVLAGAPGPVLIVVALPALRVGVAAAFRRAPERAGGAGRAIITGSAPVALSLAHAAVLLRRDGVALGRGALAALVGALVAALAARNNGVTARADQEAIALAAGAIPLAIAAASVSGRVLTTERRLDWLLLSSAASASLRAWVAAAVTAGWGAATGAIYGLSAAIALSGDLVARARVVLLGVTLGASLGAVAAHLARRAERATGVDGTAIVAGMGVSAAVIAALGAWIGALSLLPIALVALGLAGATGRLLAARERVTERAALVAWEDG